MPPSTTPDPLDVLREPFPPSAIGILPRATRKDAPKGNCGECGGWHGLPAVHLDYVGHAAVTARLLDADPAWTWEPVAWAEDGTPRVIVRGGDAVLWIRLTVGGVTRLGVGTAPKDSFELDKQLVSDALRNAAMRFGVALDLWSKEDIARHDDEPDPGPEPHPAVGVVTAAKRALLDVTGGDKVAARALWESTLADLAVDEATVNADLLAADAVAAAVAAMTDRTESGA